jgi:hypothetical protein
MRDIRMIHFQNFQNPDNEYSAVPFGSWNDDLKGENRAARLILY